MFNPDVLIPSRDTSSGDLRLLKWERLLWGMGWPEIVGRVTCGGSAGMAGQGGKAPGRFAAAPAL